MKVVHAAYDSKQPRGDLDAGDRNSRASFNDEVPKPITNLTATSVYERPLGRWSTGPPGDRRRSHRSPEGMRISTLSQSVGSSRRMTTSAFVLVRMETIGPRA